MCCPPYWRGDLIFQTSAFEFGNLCRALETASVSFCNSNVSAYDAIVNVALGVHEGCCCRPEFKCNDRCLCMYVCMQDGGFCDIKEDTMLPGEV